LHAPESQITSQRYARYVSCSSFAPIRVTRHESTDILNGQLRDVDASAPKALMQEIANDSATLIARALGQAANVLEELSETTNLVLDRVRFR
jgi:hypothetical protein